MDLPDTHPEISPLRELRVSLSDEQMAKYWDKSFSENSK
jgi:hypothetical protein